MGICKGLNKRDGKGGGGSKHPEVRGARKLFSVRVLLVKLCPPPPPLLCPPPWRSLVQSLDSTSLTPTRTIQSIARKLKENYFQNFEASLCPLILPKRTWKNFLKELRVILQN